MTTSIRAVAALCATALAACSTAADPADSVPPQSTTTAAVVTTVTSTTPPSTTTTSSGPSTTAERTDHERCLERAEFGDPALSEYVLPYPPGEGWTILQSYCHDDGSHENQLAYDFAMPLGSTVVASRSGTVIEVVEHVPDDENSRHLNYILVRHTDNTVAFYAHLQHEGSLVEVDEVVTQSQEIGLSGATGRTGGPVLHFGVYFSYPPVEGRDLPVVFSNAEGDLDSNGGLREGSFYRALAPNSG